MPAILSRARNFLQNSDYPFDKIILLKSGSLTIPTSGTTISVPHGLPFAPLVGGGWSFLSDFSLQYEYGAGSFPSGNPSFPYALTLYAYADNTNIYFDYLNVTGSPKTIYYRVTGEEPNDVNLDSPYTSNAGDRFVYSSDYNYTKQYLVGNFNPGALTSFNVVHSLGYRPQARFWHVVSGTIYPSDISNNSFSGLVSAEMLTSSLAFTLPGGGVSKVYYKIYLDE